MDALTKIPLQSLFLSLFVLFFYDFICSSFSLFKFSAIFFSILHFLFIISLSVLISLSLFKFYIFFFFFFLIFHFFFFGFCGRSFPAPSTLCTRNDPTLTSRFLPSLAISLSLSYFLFHLPFLWGFKIPQFFLSVNLTAKKF